MMLGCAQELPGGFDASKVLPGADASSKESIMDTFPLAFVLRWLLLRNEVRRDFCAVYDSQAHFAAWISASWKVLHRKKVCVRVQLPEEEWETYGKGQHLRGADAVFADQVLDELVCLLPSSAPA